MGKHVSVYEIVLYHHMLLVGSESAHCFLAGFKAHTGILAGSKIVLMFGFFCKF